MKICIIHGSPRKGNTYKATQLFMEQIQKNGDIELVEFFLPKDMPYFCCGCYNCFDKGEDKCPHSRYVQPIRNAMQEADGIIMTSPVYVLGESGGVKAFLDHFGYMYMSHRPMEEMFSKVAMVISTTAGTGTRYAIKAISRSLRFWGVKRIYKRGLTIFAKNWEEMNAEKQQKFNNLLYKDANRFYNSMRKRKQLQPQIFTKIIFFVLKRMISGYNDGHPDKEYWRIKGWGTGESNPF